MLFDSNNNDNQFYGLGINPSTLRFQIDAPAAHYVFFAGASATASNELARINGTGQVGIGTTSTTGMLNITGAMGTGLSGGINLLNTSITASTEQLSITPGYVGSTGIATPLRQYTNCPAPATTFSPIT